jgi:uncharacterized protein YuzE
VKLIMDRTTGAVYLRYRPGAIRDPGHPPEGLVEETLELGEGVFMDIDKDGNVIGVEFLSMDDFAAFLAEHPGGVELPERIEDLATYRRTTASW